LLKSTPLFLTYVGIYIFNHKEKHKNGRKTEKFMIVKSKKSKVEEEAGLENSKNAENETDAN